MKKRVAIQDAASWVLRVGVVTSVLVMLIGIIASFFHGNLTLAAIQHRKFDDSLLFLAHGIWHFEGYAIIELGILLLVFTPILRVATSMILFAFEDHDMAYAIVTLVVLALTLFAFLFLR